MDVYICVFKVLINFNFKDFINKVRKILCIDEDL